MKANTINLYQPICNNKSILIRGKTPLGMSITKITPTVLITNQINPLSISCENNGKPTTSSESASYESDYDLMNGTGFQYLCRALGNDNDQSVAGYMYLNDPSNTTFIKLFHARSSTNMSADKCENAFISGYCTTASAIDGVQFKMASGNFDGTIKMWGVK